VWGDSARKPLVGYGCHVSPSVRRIDGDNTPSLKTPRPPRTRKDAVGWNVPGARR
jgi:hypothetical protein